MDDVQPNVKLQPETLELAGSNRVIDTNDAYNEMKPIELMVAIVAKFDRVCVQSLNRHGYNGKFYFICDTGGFI